MLALERFGKLPTSTKLIWIMRVSLQECVEEVQCTSISIEAVAASYGYMCGPGMPLFERHAACFAQVYTSAIAKIIGQLYNVLMTLHAVRDAS